MANKGFKGPKERKKGVGRVFKGPTSGGRVYVVKRDCSQTSPTPPSQPTITESTPEGTKVVAAATVIAALTPSISLSPPLPFSAFSLSSYYYHYYYHYYYYYYHYYY